MQCCSSNWEVPARVQGSGEKDYHVSTAVMKYSESQLSFHAKPGVKLKLP